MVDPEDNKLVVLARSSRARASAAEGAAVRDSDGRTYAAATVELPSLRLSALQAAVAAAVSSGVTALEAAAVVTESTTVDGADAVHDLTASAPIILAGPDGAIRSVLDEDSV
ncbi:MAG TPA: cytidine deaminase [Mycobacteriales bacterium]|nr:cytidine deaminase [Mycobacteriales bacterium]